MTQTFGERFAENDLSKAEVEARQRRVAEADERRRRECDCSQPIKGRKYLGTTQCVACGRSIC